ncbi:uncharacterized protein LOC141900222 [Tubulanus polymorphus]|uniref:uncharacterized protein LOC141900222 n=1 Tax=Tubulanus polymorphus TaxID=672921 RepID=UPI003DA3CD9A
MMPASTPIRRKHLDEILCDVAQESHTLHSPSPARKQQSNLNSMKTSKNKKIISEICNQFDNTSERLYSCQQCQFECRNLYDLEVHKIDHVRSNVYVCSVCDKQYVMKSYYISHLGLHFKCSSSSSSSNNKGFTINHQTNSKRYFYIKCKFCEKVFASTAALDKHKKSHFGKNSPQGFEKMSGEKNKGSVEGAKQKIGLKRKSTDSEYSSNGNRGNLFGCNVCKETFRDGEKLENHIKSVHRNGNKNARSRNFEEVLQVWSETSLSSSSSSSSDPSVITCISDSSDTSDLCSSNDPLKLYKCRYCSNDYYHMKSLKKHMMTAHDDNCPYFCSNCNTAFHMKNDLKFHQGHCRLSNIQPATSSNIPTTTTTVAAASVSDNSNKSKPNFKLRINLIYNPKNSYADCL